MGDRAQVKVLNPYSEGDDIYLYTHWNGHCIEDTVRRALARKQRWNDFEYLTRIIFCTMVRHDINGDTGYGIGTEEHGDIERLITVDVRNSAVTVEHLWDKVRKDYSFEEFINQEDEK